MLWRDSAGFERRPIVVVEDHLSHVDDLLAAVATVRTDVLSQITVCVLERRGPDTSNAMQTWLAKYPDVQIAAHADLSSRAAPSAIEPQEQPAIHEPSRRQPEERILRITPADLGDANSCARLFARLVRPSGLLVQDIQLSTLPFLPADRWWESIYLAATTRGLFANRAPTIRFLSNKRGYAATFGRELIEAGMDPRDVMDKAELTAAVAPTFGQFLDRVFPYALDMIDEAGRRTVRVVTGDDERRDIGEALDVVLYIDADRAELGGRFVGDAPDRGAPAGQTSNEHRVALRIASHETETWRQLINAQLTQSDGIAVMSIGERVAPPGAARAEMTNLAARHVHTLRGRLADPSAIVTANHAYRLKQGLRVGLLATRGA